MRTLSALTLATTALALIAACQSTPPTPTPLITSDLPPVYTPDAPPAPPGQFKNPIIFADYSDPDICRVGDDYYMTASSFSCFPGLPILHSRDLVHWVIIGHALVRYPAPLDRNFDAPAHGAGVWAPSIRHHNGTFYIYFGDPDLGVFMTKTKDPAGTWDPLVRVREAKGWIDTCPLWDEDGSVYLVHAFANSRAGIANVLDICRLSSDGTRVLDDNPTIPGNGNGGGAVGTRIYDGGQPTLNPPRPPAPAFATAPRYTTVEGPKFYKRNGIYYIMAPGGGVTAGYQIVFRAKNVLGPYESRIVLDRGTTTVNGPHQGGWVTTPAGEDWFMHFQEILPYGRIVHIQPVTWTSDWPIMGEVVVPTPPSAGGGSGPGAEKGQPVVVHALPKSKIENQKSKIENLVPQTSDEFATSRLGLQWQWWANFNPAWADISARPGFLRLTPVSLSKPTPLYNRPNLLLQKFPAESFTVTTRVDLSALGPGESAGLVLAGKTMSSLTCTRTPPPGTPAGTAPGIRIARTNFTAPNSATAPPPADAEDQSITLTPRDGTILLRMKVAPRGICSFQASADGTAFTDLGRPITAINATWIGAKVGIFCNAAPNTNPTGHADFDFFHIEP